MREVPVGNSKIITRDGATILKVRDATRKAADEASRLIKIDHTKREPQSPKK